MSRKKKNKITTGGNMPRPGQPFPATIVLTQPKRFGIDIADYTTSVKAFENVDFSRRYKLYDLYSDILMDTHLSSVINKRILSVLSSDIEFRRDGKPDEAINIQIRSPWFRRLVKDVLDAQFWGFTLCQFFRKGEWVDYDLIPRKHTDPVRRIIMRHQTDITGTSWDEYADLLFVGDKDDLGLLAKAAPWVIYKRNTTADWAQFSEVFGMPIREYTYETDDDEARRRTIEDAQNTGSLAVLVHSKESKLELKESGNKTGSADLYERLCERCNSEISKLILGNTLTTEASDKGTQALGTVHQKVEDKVSQADRRYLLEVLNYEMTDIFLSMGINTEGGNFCFADANATDVNELQIKANILTQLKNTFNLPIADSDLYNTFSGIVEKPKDYKQLKEQAIQAQEPKREPTPAKEDLEDGVGKKREKAILKDIIPKAYYKNSYWMKNYGIPNPMRFLLKFVCDKDEFEDFKKDFKSTLPKQSELNDIREMISIIDSEERLNDLICDLTDIAIKGKNKNNFFETLKSFFVQARHDRAALDW